MRIEYYPIQTLPKLLHLHCLHRSFLWHFHLQVHVYVNSLLTNVVHPNEVVESISIFMDFQWMLLFLLCMYFV